MRTKWLPYACHCIDKDEEKAVLKVLRSSHLTQGKTVTEFEEAICHEIGCKHAIAVSSGTAALWIALRVKEISQSYVFGRVISTPLTFIATVNAMYDNSMSIILTDIDKESLMIAPKSDVKGAVIVHYSGRPQTFEQWKGFKGWIIEDAAHSFGARRAVHKKLAYIPKGAKGTELKYEMVGSGSHGITTCFSTHAIKTITTGEGGIITTNNDEEAEVMRSMRDHGRVNGECVRLGLNFRMTDIQAAIGIEQLKKRWFLPKREEIACIYNNNLDELLDYIELPTLHPEGGLVTSAWHLYVIRLKLDKLKIDRDEFIRQMAAENIGCQVNYKPVYLQPFYKPHFQPENFPNCESEWKRLVSLPIHNRMVAKDVFDVIHAMWKVINRNKQEGEK